MFPKCLLALWLVLLIAGSEQGALPSTTVATPRITPSVSRYTNKSADACSLSCSSNIGQLTVNYWTPLSIATTITAETVVTIINKKSNSTRVTTITNQEVDFSKYPKPTNLNSDGTQTHLVTDLNEQGSGFTTITLTFPSIYVQYDSVYHLSGQVPTTVDGKSTCTSISKADGAAISWPSHPPLPLTTGTVDSALLHQDPKGWTFFHMAGPDNNPDVARVLDDSSDYPLIKSLFPNLPIWSCQGLASGVGNGPDGFSSTALFLTDTSTSIEDDDNADMATADRSKTSVMVDAVSAQPTPSAKVKPNQTPQSPAPASVAQPPIPSQTPGKSTDSESSSSDGDTPSKPSIFADEDGSAARPGKTPSRAVAAPYSTPSGPDTLPAKPTALGGQDSGNEGEGADEQSGTQEQNVADDSHSDSNPNPVANNGMTTTAGRAMKSNGPLDTINSHPGSVQHAEDATALIMPPDPVVFGGQTLTPIEASHYIVAGHTIVPGPQPMTIKDGNSAMPMVLQSSQGKLVFSVGSAGTVLPMKKVDGNPATQSFAPDGRPLVTSNAQGQYLVSGQTLSPGKVNTVAEKLVSVAPSGASIAVLGPKTTEAAAGVAYGNGPSPVLTFASQAITPDAQGQLVVAGQTLSPGGAPISVSGIPISLNSAGDVAIIGGSKTQTLANHPAVTPAPSPASLTFGKQTIAPNSRGQYIIDGQTISPGKAITISGTPISLDAGGHKVVIGGSLTQDLGPHAARPTPTAALTLGASTIAPDSQGRYVVDGQTLQPGSAITAAGTVISLHPDGSLTENPATNGPAPSKAIIFGMQTVTPNSLGQYIVNGQTLSAGGAVTVSGTPISLDSGGSVAVVGTKTEGLGYGASTTGLNGNSGNGTASRSGATPFTGVASNNKMSPMALAVSAFVWGLGGVIALL